MISLCFDVRRYYSAIFCFNMRYSFSIILLLFLPFCIFAKTISPLDIGLKQAKNGEERFRVLYQTHALAKKNHWDVSYKGIKELSIEIPSDAKSIPLGNVTDFKGVILTVTNTKKKNFFLFELSQELHPISVPKTLLDTYDFGSVKELNQGNKILVIKDDNPWVENRAGHDYGATRKDILFLKNGKALNKTIATYDNASSRPSCSFAEVTKEQKTISNITFKRTKESKCKTFFVRVQNMNNVLLQGIRIITPTPVEMTADMAIGIYNCTNISVRHVTINQTYSLSTKSGYGIQMNNVWNSWFDDIKSEAAWGIFGNNNIHNAHISNCRINRFDTHCYGKDVYFSNCIITLIGLPQSSFLGELVFSRCTFQKAYVCVARTDYNAFTPFKIILNDCDIYLDRQHTCLINLGNIDAKTNSRKELNKKYSPSLSVVNSKVYLTDGLSNWSLFLVGGHSGKSPFDFIGDIAVDGLTVEGNSSTLQVFNRRIKCRRSASIDIKKVGLMRSDKNIKALKQKKILHSPTIVTNIEGSSF